MKKDQMIIENYKEIMYHVGGFNPDKSISENLTNTECPECARLLKQLAALESSDEPEQRTAEEIISIYNRIVSYTNNIAMVDHILYVKAIFLIKAMELFAELRQGKAKTLSLRKQLLLQSTECKSCGHQNGENCNTCDVLNPQFR